jgi:predicted transposase/invertase (TIGR01784 family)
MEFDMKNRVFFEADDDIVDICRDNVFKAVFTKDAPESKAALSKLVSALIGREVSIMEILANEPPPGSTGDRQIRYDINCRAADGELVDVEMSLNPSRHEPVRLEFHTAKLFAGQNIRGADKTYDDLKLAYQITILVKEQFFNDGEFFHAFEYYDPVRGVSLDGRSRIITLELEKFEKIAEKTPSEMSLREQWSFFFRYLTDREKRGKINEIIEKAEGIAMASEVVMTISRDEHERARLLNQEKSELDYQSRMAEAVLIGTAQGQAIGEAIGLEKGEAIGLEKGEQNIINLLKSGKSPKEIIAAYDKQ